MITIFEKFKSQDDWQVGDKVVALQNRYAGGTNWILKDSKYVISEISGHKEWIKLEHEGDFWHEKRFFVTEEEWNLRQVADKYNL